MEVISKSEALLKGLRHYFTGKICKRGHLLERFVSNGRCVECSRILDRAQYQKDKDKICERMKTYRFKNHEERIKYERQYREDNYEDVLKRSRKWKENNPERTALKSKEWKKLNRDKVYASNAKRRASKLQRTPGWLTEEDYKEIVATYKKARLFSKYCGQKYVVDHRIPLQGKLVSGLHVPSNLHVITASENQSKNNKFEIN